MRCCVGVRHGDVPSEASSACPRDQRHAVWSLAIFSCEAQRFFLRRDAGSSKCSPYDLVDHTMSLLPTSAFSASKTVESSGGNSFATVTHSIVPSRIPAAIRITSSDRRRPNAVTGGASNHSPVCGAREASRRAWSSALLADLCKIVHALFVQQLSHALWRWAAAPVGGSEPVCAIHDSSAVLTSSSEVSADSGGSRFAWSSLVLAADAKTAESASVAAERIPRQPPFTGKDAWSQFSSDSSTFKILDSPLLSSESNLARLGWSTQRAEALRVSLPLVPGLPPSYSAPCQRLVQASEVILVVSPLLAVFL